MMGRGGLDSGYSLKMMMSFMNSPQYYLSFDPLQAYHEIWTLDHHLNWAVVDDNRIVLVFLREALEGSCQKALSTFQKN